MKRYCEKCKKETEWKEGFLLDLHVDYCTICKTAVGNLNSPKNKTPAQMQDDEPAGFEVFNPAEQEDTGKSWTWYMRKDIAGLMECDAIFLLKDWEESKGARLEYYIAQQLEMKIFREVEQ